MPRAADLRTRHKQRDLRMQRLQVLRLEAGITPRHFKRRMAKGFLEMEDTPASPDVIQRKRMPECVQASLWRIEAKTAAQLFDIAENVATTEFRSIAGNEDHRV